MKDEPVLLHVLFFSVLSWPPQAGVGGEALVSARSHGRSHAWCLVSTCVLIAREEIPSFAYSATEILMQNKSSGLNRTSDQGERNGV